ncbi:amidohydrolase family protein [Salegentibacter sp. F14]
MKTFVFIVAFIISWCGSAQTPIYDLVIKEVGLFDGYQDQGIVNLAINADTIAEISTKDLKGRKSIAGAGYYLIPGLVNAHVHVSRKEHLKTGYPLGVLTLLNMHTGLEDREQRWKKITKDSSGFSRLYGAGNAATVPGGHPTQFSPNMETINDSLSIEEWVNHRIAENVDYIKIVREQHEWFGKQGFPALDFEQIHQIIDYAHSKGYKVVVHSNTVEEMMKIAEFEPDGFVHMLEFKDDYPVPEAYYQTLKKSGVFIVTNGGMALKPKDNAPPFIRQWIENNLLDAEQRAEIIKKMNENNILLVVGTDAQEEKMDFGSDYFFELQLYKMAGLSNEEILKAATGNAAKAFDLPIGELKVGSKADMILLKEDPLIDIENLKKVKQIWKNGKTL